MAGCKFTLIVGVKRYGPLPHYPHPRPSMLESYWFTWFIITRWLEVTDLQRYQLLTYTLPCVHTLETHARFARILYDNLKYFEGFLDFHLAIHPNVANYRTRFFSRCTERKVRRPILVDRHMGGKCSICLIKYRLPLVRLSSCTHRFHTRCINKWLAKKRNCPMCRRDVESEWETVHEFVYYMDNVSSSSG